MQQWPPDASKNPPDRTYASLRSDLGSNDQLRNWQIVLKKSGDGRKLSGTLTRVACGDGGADDDYCCPGRNGTGARLRAIVDLILRPPSGAADHGFPTPLRAHD